MKTLIAGAALSAVLLCACPGPSPQPGASEEAAIVKRMHATWDRPHAPLEAGPVVIDGDWAVADWTQAAMGGRALLHREHGAWSTVLCAGDGIKGADGLIEAGVPRAQARALAAKLAAAEVKIAPDRLALISTFAGIVRMQGAGHGDRH